MNRETFTIVMSIIVKALIIYSDMLQGGGYPLTAVEFRKKLEKDFEEENPDLIK